MKIVVAIVAFLMMSFSPGYAQNEEHSVPTQNQESTQPQAPSGSAMGAGPAGGMAEMMGMMHPSIAVDAEAIYIVRGDQVLKLNKDDLRVISSATLPPQHAMGEMTQEGMAGRGPAMAMARPEMAQMMQQMRQMQPAQFERSFLQNMIRHHQGAIAMSQLALSRATHAELRQFAQKTINNQGCEQQQFASWLKSWYNAFAVRQPTQMDAQMIEQLRNLSGRDFEIRFMQDMITHHTEGVQMARDAEQRAVHPEVKAAAAKIVNDQSAEIVQLQNWLSSWYRINPSNK